MKQRVAAMPVVANRCCLSHRKSEGVENGHRALVGLSLAKEGGSLARSPDHVGRHRLCSGNFAGHACRGIRSDPCGARRPDRGGGRGWAPRCAAAWHADEGLPNPSPRAEQAMGDRLAAAGGVSLQDSFVFVDAPPVRIAIVADASRPDQVARLRALSSAMQKIARRCVSARRQPS